MKIIVKFSVQVVQKIKENPLRCELLVISEEGAEWYKEHNIPITTSLPNIIHVSEEEVYFCFSCLLYSFLRNIVVTN